MRKLKDRAVGLTENVVRTKPAFAEYVLIQTTNGVTFYIYHLPWFEHTYQKFFKL